jgi:hypothetical protein
MARDTGELWPWRLIFTLALKKPASYNRPGVNTNLLALWLTRNFNSRKPNMHWKRDDAITRGTTIGRVMEVAKSEGQELEFASSISITSESSSLSLQTSAGS